MTVLYRAIWSDAETIDPTAAVHQLAGIAASWATDSPNSAPLADGRTEVEIRSQQRSIQSHRFGDEGFEINVHDHMRGGATDWTTLIKVVRVENTVHCLVENGMESANLTQRVTFRRPKVVHQMLRAATKPCLGGSGLLTEPQAIPANGIEILTSVLANPARTVPVIVCSQPAGPHDADWTSVASDIAAGVEGVAVVFTLDQDAVTAFRKELGDLAIWGGGIRIYLPNPVSPGSEGWRHRYYVHKRLQLARQATVNRIIYSVAQLSARRRVPDVFNEFSDQVEAASTGGAAELTEERDYWQFQYELSLEERSELEKELAQARGHLSRLKSELITKRLDDLVWGTKDEDSTSIPDEVQDTSEAVIAARMYLSDWLNIPDTAERELEAIDTAPESYVWGNASWRGLRALAAYAKDRAGGWGRGGFWEWCASGPVDGWPATDKKLSMTEGEGVQTRKKLSRTRVFDVDPAVDPTGRLTMLAHLKVAEGGGNIVPRIYFHDDTGGKTRKVHVGFVGPHYLVPNKSAN
ncbi:hypothetical protein ACWEQD_15660 [Rhodococcus pyridinivorans]